MDLNEKDSETARLLEPFLASITPTSGVKEMRSTVVAGLTALKERLDGLGSTAISRIINQANKIVRLGDGSARKYALLAGVDVVQAPRGGYRGEYKKPRPK